MTEDLPLYFIMRPLDDDRCHFSRTALTLKEGVELVDETPGVLLIEIAEGSSAFEKNQIIGVRPIHNPHKLCLNTERA